jgi:hypothetical protein
MVASAAIAGNTSTIGPGDVMGDIFNGSIVAFPSGFQTFTGTQSTTAFVNGTTCYTPGTPLTTRRLARCLAGKDKSPDLSAVFFCWAAKNPHRRAVAPSPHHTFATYEVSRTKREASAPQGKRNRGSGTWARKRCGAAAVGSAIRTDPQGPCGGRRAPKDRDERKAPTQFMTASTQRAQGRLIETGAANFLRSDLSETC